MLRVILSVITFFVIAVENSRQQVLGIDFGDEFFKMSLISAGKTFLIIENSISKRKTPTSVGFFQGERFYESEAIVKRTRSPTNTFVFVKKFLGALAADEKIVSIAKTNYEEYQYALDEERGTFKFDLKDFRQQNSDEEMQMSVEELVAMILRRGKWLAEKQTEIKDIKDCIITIPNNWGLAQMNALQDATKIAGLNLLGLIYENSAVALYHSIQRNDNETHYAMFYNIGSSGLQVTLAELFNVKNEKNNTKPIQSVKILADAWDTEVSGNVLDQILREHFANEFDQLKQRQGKPSIREYPKSMIKLQNQCNKVKEVLSANKESLFFVEGLHDEIDFRSKITRQEFEDMARHVWERLLTPIERVLNIANKTIDQINSFEIVGGGVIVPKIQEVLTQYLGNLELGQHLNKDETPALGACFQAANMSHSFKVRQINLYDGFNFAVRLVIKNLDQDLEEDQKYHKDITIFPYKQRFGSKKVLSFTYNQNLQFEFYSVDQQGQSNIFQTINVTNIKSLSENEKYQSENFTKPKLHFQFGIDSLNPISLQQAEAHIEETKYEEVKIPIVEIIKKQQKVKEDEVKNNGEEEENQEETEENQQQENNGEEKEKNNAEEEEQQNKDNQDEKVEKYDVEVKYQSQFYTIIQKYNIKCL